MALSNSKAMIMKGYWNRPEDTKKVIDAEGFFHSGDVGKMEASRLFNGLFLLWFISSAYHNIETIDFQDGLYFVITSDSDGIQESEKVMIID